MRNLLVLAALALAGCSHLTPKSGIESVDLCEVTEDRGSSPRGRVVRLRAVVGTTLHGVIASDPACGLARGVVVIARNWIKETEAFKHMSLAGMPPDSEVEFELTGLFEWKRKVSGRTLTLTEPPVVVPLDDSGSP